MQHASRDPDFPQVGSGSDGSRLKPFLQETPVVFAQFGCFSRADNLHASAPPVAESLSRQGFCRVQARNFQTPVDIRQKPVLIFEPMTQRNNPVPNALRQPHSAAAMLHAALPSYLTAPLAIAALILVLVLITGPTSAEYGIA